MRYSFHIVHLGDEINKGRDVKDMGLYGLIPFSSSSYEREQSKNSNF